MTATHAEDAHARLLAAEERVGVLREERDDAIREEIREGRTMYSIAQELGISQQAVRKIRDAGK